MASYVKVKFHLSESQMKKLHSAHIHKKGITLTLGSHMIGDGGIPLELTSGEYNKIMKGGNHKIKISASRVKRGGFLPALIAAIPTIAAAISGVAGAASLGHTISNWAQGRGTINHYLGNGKTMHRANGVISDLNIPIISPLARMVGLGRGRRGKALYWSK